MPDAALPPPSPYACRWCARGCTDDPHRSGWPRGDRRFRHRKWNGFGGLAATVVVVTLVTISLLLGAIATVAALLRRERWVPAQVAGFAVNFFVGLPIVAHALPDVLRRWL